jgi:hypothetical protein
MMMYMAVHGESVWTNPNLIAVMWVGPSAVRGGFGWPTIIGFATHMATSLVMGVVGVVFIASLPPRRTLLAALAYALASYPVVVGFVMTWANPLFVERTTIVPMTIAHAVFGAVYGAVYLGPTTSGRTAAAEQAMTAASPHADEAPD